MNREEITRMAREAGFVIDEASRQHQPKCIGFTHYLIDDELSRFAALVAAAEREACAKVCDETLAQHYMKQTIPERDEALFLAACVDCAAAIRARGQA